MKVIVLSEFDSHKKRLKNQIESPHPAILRMGYVGAYNEEKHIVLNTSKSIYLCSDKINSKKLFLKNSISTPMGYNIYWKKKEEKDNSTHFVFEIVNFAGIKLTYDNFLQQPKIAKLSHRKAGRGMVLLENKHQIISFLKLLTDKIIDDDYYFESYLPYEREFRIHVCALGCIHAAEKENDIRYTKLQWCMESNSCEFHTIFKRPSCWPYIIEECQRVLTLLKLDVGGFDIRVNKRGNMFTLIECNSGPSISNASADKYKYWIPKLIEHKIKNK